MRPSSAWSIVAISLLAPLSISQATPAEPAAPKAPGAKAPASAPAAEYTRLVETSRWRGRFETAVTTFEDKEGRRVDLVSAVHIGDRAYYEELNRVLRDYERVLYEMVKPDGEPMPEPAPEPALSNNPLSLIQRFLSKALELDFQVDAIDYGAKNFVHADISPERLAELVDEKAGGLIGLLLEAILDQLRRGSETQVPENVPDLGDLLGALFAPDRADRLKMMFGRMLGDVEMAYAGLGTSKLQEILIAERNKVAVAALRTRLGAGDHRLAIFYGAAHMPDMAERLHELGFRRTASRWITAWRIGKPAAETRPAPAPGRRPI